MEKLAILVLSSNTYPSVRNSKIQKKVFFNQPDSTSEIYWYKRGTEEELQGLDSCLSENDLFINADDSSLGMGEKTIIAFKWLIENSNFEYIFRTNTSSYVSIKKLRSFINDNYKNEKYVYSGLIHKTNDSTKMPISFASGSGFLLNRKTVELILENLEKWQHEYWDDVSLGILLRDLNILPTQGKRFDIEGNVFKQDINLDNYHYRCRIDNHYGYPRLLERYVISYLNKLDIGKDTNKIIRTLNSSLFEIFKLFYIHQFGWKIYSLIKSIMKIIFPKNIYKFIKKLFITQITDFKLKRFKT
tara:strand:+ start:30820 stop:31725 length:906 start_codon:yes stop_codon:yes gene_type:complete